MWTKAARNTACHSFAWVSKTVNSLEGFPNRFPLSHSSSHCLVQSCPIGYLPFQLLLYLAHEACCSSDQHVFPCIVFWDVHHDVCSPVQWAPQHHSTCTEKKKQSEKRKKKVGLLWEQLHVWTCSNRRFPCGDWRGSQDFSLEENWVLCGSQHSRDFSRSSDLPYVQQGLFCFFFPLCQHTGKVTKYSSHSSGPENV